MFLSPKREEVEIALSNSPYIVSPVSAHVSCACPYSHGQLRTYTVVNIAWLTYK